MRSHRRREATAPLVALVTHHALHRWFDDHPDELGQVRTQRPDGPLAISYYTTGARHPRRYDHVLVSHDVDVAAIEYRPPHAEGSDHGAIVTELDIRPTR